MNNPQPICITDTCIGGLSVVRSLWAAGVCGNAVFTADYEVNPLGVKSDAEIAAVVERWFDLAQTYSDTLIIACNTLSIRYEQLIGSTKPSVELNHVVSMVDCFRAMIKTEAKNLSGRRVLIIGTEFTASQRLYPDLLCDALPSVSVSTIGATELERRIARFQPLEDGGEPVFGGHLREAISNADAVVLACTCFPMVKKTLKEQFPGVVFLDPGAYCADLLIKTVNTQGRNLRIDMTGNVVSRERVIEFAQSYLGADSLVTQGTEPVRS